MSFPRITPPPLPDHTTKRPINALYGLAPKSSKAYYKLVSVLISWGCLMYVVLNIQYTNYYYCHDQR